MTYETSNKLYGPIWGDIPAVWVQEIARYMKQLGPKKTGFVDGIYGVDKPRLSVPKVEIFFAHVYALNDTKLQNNIDLVRSVNNICWSGEL